MAANDNINGKKLLIIRGAPGCGKATMAKYWSRFGFIPVSPDDYLNRNKSNFKAIKTAENKCRLKAKWLLNKGSKVVVYYHFNLLKDLTPFLNLVFPSNLLVIRPITIFRSKKPLNKNQIVAIRRAYQPLTSEKHAFYQESTDKVYFL